MNRRRFINSSAAIGVSFLSSNSALARLVCSPFAPGVQACAAGIDSNIIGVTAAQNMTQWCWAACIEMVFRYYGYRVPQQQIVQETWGAIVNMPGQPNQILMDLNRPWRDINGQVFGVSGDAYSTNAITAAQDLANDMPLIVGTMGHAMVLTKLDYLVGQYGNGEVKIATVRDPWPGRGRRMLTAQEWYNISFAARIRVSRA